MARFARSGLPPRVLALVLAVFGVAVVLSIESMLQESPVREGEPAPRTVVAPELIRVVDADATRRAQNEAVADVQPVLVEDDTARAEIVEQVRDSFALIERVRTSPDGEDPPTPAEQRDALAERLTMLDSDGVARAVELSDSELESTAGQAEQAARALARGQIHPDALADVRERQLPSELATHDFPDGVAEDVVEPIVADALRPTVAEDEAATAEAQQRAREEVAEVVRTFPQDTTIVRAGETVDEVHLAALQQAGLEGADPWRFALRALLLTAATVFAASVYLRAYRRRVWSSPRRLVLLSVLLLSFALVLEAVTLLAPTTANAWLFVLPAGAVAMLATILLDPPIGVLSTIPTTALTAFVLPGEPAVIVFVALASLGSVPLVSRLSARGDLRKAAVRSTLGYALLAALAVAAFDQLDQVPLAAAAGLANGVVTAVIVNGSLPFLESAFAMLTATSLLDLADRNHPLLRELEHKALGSYNHSIMVSQMVERGSRAVGADGLLASVAALYHDIGKTRRPYFFIENQFGIANPHDELPAHESVRIIKDHVPHGLELARRHRLPPEIMDGIACHHGTTLVSYFHDKASAEASDGEHVEEADFRYPGPKPASREMAILMLADCCESAARATALDNRNLTREDLVTIVHTLVQQRVEDGQLDESALTFRDLAVVQDSFIETLVGVYHPRIAYPGREPAGEPALPDESQERVAEPSAADGRDTASRPG